MHVCRIPQRVLDRGLDVTLQCFVSLQRKRPPLAERLTKFHTEEVEFAVYLFDTTEALHRLIRGDETNKSVLMMIAVSILQNYDEVLAAAAKARAGNRRQAPRRAEG